MWKAQRVNVAIAAFALVLFQVVAMASGRLDANGGLGWDGAMYAQMVTGHLRDGTPNTAVRPFIILLVRIPYHLGLSVIGSFEVVNAIAGFVLYLVAALLLQRGGLGIRSRALVVANLALTISVSKMYGFYPALIDLGALAVISTTFYLVWTDRFRMGAAVALLATASREFGIAAAVFGMHRAVRRGRWRDAALFMPSLAVPVLIRLPWLGILPASGRPLSTVEALTNLRMWAHLPFVTTFAYFCITLLGGLTILLMVRPEVIIARLRQEPELATFIALVMGPTAAGGNDIWRYSVYALPAVLVLVAEGLRDFTPAASLRVLAVVSVMTVLTQRPLQRMNTDSYFLEWFPLYRVPPGAIVPPPDVLNIWLPRLAILVVEIVAVYLLIRHARRVDPVYA